MKSQNLTLFILGAGGFARELQSYVYKHDSRFYVLLVDDREYDALPLDDYYWQHSRALLPAYSIMGSGKCEIKRRMLDQIRGTIYSFRHPKADVAWSARTGQGCIISAGAVVAPSVWLGDHVLCNYNSTIGHNSVIGDLSVIAPNAAIGGFCTLGKEVYVGAGACIKEGIEVGDGATIGMGAVVTKPVPPGVTVIGVPARIMEKKDDSI